MDSANPVYSEQPRDDVYGAYDGSYLQNSGPKQATQSPIVTGTSVIALKFKDGVVMAADNLGASPPPLEKSRVTFQS
jgi:20S proteasome alpha/beta subunit